MVNALIAKKVSGINIDFIKTYSNDFYIFGLVCFECGWANFTGEKSTSIATNSISVSVEKHVATLYDNLIINTVSAQAATGDSGDCSSVVFGRSITSLLARYEI